MAFFTYRERDCHCEMVEITSILNFVEKFLSKCMCIYSKKPL